MIKSIRRKKISIGSIILHLALILLSLSFVLPLLTVISVSFTNEDVLREAGYSLIPKKFDIAGYQYIFANPMKLVDAYLVTIFESAVATILSLIVMSALAYALSRKNFLLKKPITYYLLFTMENKKFWRPLKVILQKQKSWDKSHSICHFSLGAEFPSM